MPPSAQVARTELLSSVDPAAADGHELPDRRRTSNRARTGHRDLAPGVCAGGHSTLLQERAIRRGEVLTEQLHYALNSRVLLGQAMGVLAHAGNLDMDRAFPVLRGYARNDNTRLSQVAQHLVSGTCARRRSSPRYPPHADRSQTGVVGGWLTAWLTQRVTVLIHRHRDTRSVQARSSRG